MPLAVASAAGLRAYTARNFGGGLDIKTSPLQLAGMGGREPNRLTRATHGQYTVEGAFRKRDDLALANAMSLGASVAITGGIQYRRSDGTSEVVIGTDDGRLVRLDPVAGTTVDLATGYSTGTRWGFALFADDLIAVNGVNVPKKYNGTSVTTLGGSPPATAYAVVSHSARVFMLDNTARQRFSWSKLGDHENWTAADNAGALFIQTVERLTGLVSASQSELILAAPGALFRLQGSSPSTYALTNVVPASSASGGVSFQAILFAMNDIFLLAQAGIHSYRGALEFGDLKESFTSERIGSFFEPNTPYTLALQNLQYGVGCYDRQNGRLLFACDSDGDAHNDVVFLYDLSSRAWSVWPGMAVASLWTVVNPTTGVEEVCAGGYDGYVRIFDRRTSTNPIEAEARHVSDLGMPGVIKAPRHLYLYLAETGNFEVDVDIRKDFGSEVVFSGSASTLGSGHTLGVNWVLGVDPLGVSGSLAKRINLGGFVCEHMEVAVRNSQPGQPFTYFGYHCLSRPRRVIGRG